MNILRKVLLGGFCVFFIFVLSGCVYLRLAKIKKQLRDFDEKITILEDEYFSIVFADAALLPRDVVWMMKQEPTYQENGEQGLVYGYVLEKQYKGQKGEEGNFDLPLRYVFRDGKVGRIDLDKGYLTLVHRELTLAILKAIGKAKINYWSKSMTLKLEKLDVGLDDLPDVNDVLATLGEPYDVNESVYTWKYLHKRGAGEEGKKHFSNGKITFDKETGKMKSAFSKLYHHGYGVNFEKLFEDAKKEKGKGEADKTN